MNVNFSLLLHFVWSMRMITCFPDLAMKVLNGSVKYSLGLVTT